VVARWRRILSTGALLVAALPACSGRSIRHVANTSGAGGSTSGGAGAGGDAGDTPTPDCSYASIARLCVIGGPGGDEYRFSPGDAVRVSVSPSRCVSASCTDAVIDEVSVSQEEDSEPGHFTVNALLCFAPNEHASEPSSCSPCTTLERTVVSSFTLREGTNVVTLGGLEVTLQAPSTVPKEDLCAGLEL